MQNTREACALLSSRAVVHDVLFCGSFRLGCDVRLGSRFPACGSTNSMGRGVRYVSAITSLNPRDFCVTTRIRCIAANACHTCTGLLVISWLHVEIRGTKATIRDGEGLCLTQCAISFSSLCAIKELRHDREGAQHRRTNISALEPYILSSREVI